MHHLSRRNLCRIKRVWMCGCNRYCSCCRGLLLTEPGNESQRVIGVVNMFAILLGTISRSNQIILPILWTSSCDAFSAQCIISLPVCLAAPCLWITVLVCHPHQLLHLVLHFLNRFKGHLPQVRPTAANETQRRLSRMPDFRTVACEETKGLQ